MQVDGEQTQALAENQTRAVISKFPNSWEARLSMNRSKYVQIIDRPLKKGG